FLIPFAGFLSDRFGRKPIYLIGAAMNVFMGFVTFSLLGTKNPMLVFIAIIIGAVPHSLVYGTQAALIAEQFTPRLRYSGASIGYQLASIIAGGPAPIIATALLAQYHSGTPVAIYMAICAVFGFIATLFLHEYSGRDVSEEYAHVGGSVPATPSRQVENR
ncbi:MAG: MFS transporter, partial [Verrucomicrobia bacterium]|nr:MFS transporter [Verrucomicrobiota bacterium]